MRIGLISLVEIWQIQYIKIKDKCQSLFFRISPLFAFLPNTPGNRAASQRDFPVRLSKKPRRVRGPQAANQVKSIFRGGVYVAKNTLRGESVFSRILCVKTRGSERKLFCQKRAPPFFDKLKSLDRAGQGIFQLLQVLQALLAYRYLRMPSVATEASAVRVTVNFTVLASLNLSSQHRNFSTAVKSSLCTILQRLST